MLLVTIDERRVTSDYQQFFILIFNRYEQSNFYNKQRGIAKEQNQIILYRPNDTISLEVRLENETIWFTQAQIAELFGTKRPAITKHINNIYSSNELEANSTCSILEHMGNDGNQKYTTKYYNLDVILSVGYRVNSLNATRFRQWPYSNVREPVWY